MVVAERGGLTRVAVGISHCGDDGQRGLTRVAICISHLAVVGRGGLTRVAIGISHRGCGVEGD